MHCFPNLWDHGTVSSRSLLFCESHFGKLINETVEMTGREDPLEKLYEVFELRMGGGAPAPGNFLRPSVQGMMVLLETGMPGGCVGGLSASLSRNVTGKHFIFFKALELRLLREGHQPEEDLYVKRGQGISNNVKCLPSVHLPRGLWVLLAVAQEFKHP